VKTSFPSQILSIYTSCVNTVVCEYFSSRLVIFAFRLERTSVNQTLAKTI